ncbi:hypothetical protein L209DRAFT_69114 [Thermothelomyces heterothallicus CBS 203.75]
MVAMYSNSHTSLPYYFPFFPVYSLSSQHASVRIPKITKTIIDTAQCIQATGIKSQAKQRHKIRVCSLPKAGPTSVNSLGCLLAILPPQRSKPKKLKTTSPKENQPNQTKTTVAMQLGIVIIRKERNSMPMKCFHHGYNACMSFKECVYIPPCGV